MRDEELLAEYGQRRSERAFALLTERYRRFVFATCLRQLRDPVLAEDVTQSVFLLLSEKAPELPVGTVISRWLFYAACNLAKNARRKENRRRQIEQQLVVEARECCSPRGMSVVSPLLNEALCALSCGELDMLLMRFVEELSLREIGQAVGVTEEAARKRVNRALTKLRASFEQAGVLQSLQQTKGAVKTMLSETEVVREIDHCYQEVDNAYASKDEARIREVIDRLFAQRFHTFDLNGNPRDEKRDEVIRDLPKAIAQGLPETERSHEVQLVSLQGNTAVVRVHLRVVRVKEGPPVFRLSQEDTWVREADGWKLFICKQLSGSYSET